MQKIVNYYAIRGYDAQQPFNLPRQARDNLMQSLKKGDVRGFGSGPLRVDRPETYEFLRGLLGEVAEKFPDETFHGGGDEVSHCPFSSTTSF